MHHAVFQIKSTLRYYIHLFIITICLFSMTTLKAEEVHLTSGKILKGNLSSSIDGLIVKQKRGEKIIGWRDVDWIVIERKDFTVMSRVLPDKTLYFAETFERYSNEMKNTFKFKRPKMKNWRVRIRIFRDYKSMQEYEIKSSGDTCGGCGYFWVDIQNNVEELVIADLPRDPGETFDTLLHEGTHFILHLWGKVKSYQFPTWIDEGLAEYFGGSTYYASENSRKATFVQGIIKPGHLFEIQEKIKNDTAVSLDEFFLMGYDTFDTEHYSQAWSLIHFIANQNNGSMAPLLYKYCYELRRTVREGSRAIDLFSKTMRVKLNKFESEWKYYVLDLKPKCDEDRLAIANEYLWRGEADKALSVLSDLMGPESEGCQAAVIQAEALAWKNNYKDAFNILEWALKKKPNYIPAIRRRAFIAQEEEKWKQAVNDFETYLDQQPFDLIAGINYIRCLLRYAGSKENTRKAISYGKKLLDYHDDAELHCVVGHAFYQNGDSEKAREHLEKARALETEVSEIMQQIDDLEKIIDG